MKKKCKVCSAPLSNERCDYCGTEHGAKKKTSSESDDFLNYDIPANDVPINDVPGFDVPNAADTQTQDSQPMPMMMESKRFNPAIIVGIIIALIIVGILWFLLSGRDGSRDRDDSNLDAVDLFERSLVAMEDVESMIVESTMDMRITAPGVSMDIPFNGRMYLEMLNTDDFNMSLETDMSALGMEERVSMYFRDGYLYTVEHGVVNRESIFPDEALDVALENMAIMDGMMVINRDLGTSTEIDMMEPVSVTPLNDGYRLEFVLDFDELMSNFFIEQEMNLFELGDELEIEDFVIVFYLDEDYMHTSASLETSISFTDTGITGTIDLSMGLLMFKLEMLQLTSLLILMMQRT